MKNLLALAALVVIVIAGAGWYLGWYQIKTVPGQGGHQQVTIDVNAPKIGEDLQKGGSKLTELIKDSKNPNQPGQTTSPNGPPQTWIPFGDGPYAQQPEIPPQNNYFPPAAPPQTTQNSPPVPPQIIQYTPPPPPQTVQYVPPPPQTGTWIPFGAGEPVPQSQTGVQVQTRRGNFQITLPGFPRR